MGCLHFKNEQTYQWDDANSICQMDDEATLLEITSEEEMDFVQMELQFLETVIGSKHWWVAGTDVGVNGNWTWATSWTPVGEFVWAPSFPNTRPNSNCLMLHYNYDFMATNQACDYEGYYPICQRK